MFSNRLDITLLKTSGKRVRNIEFAALCKMSRICDTSFPIQEQEFPAFPARELACKGVVEITRKTRVASKALSCAHKNMGFPW